MPMPTKDQIIDAIINTPECQAELKRLFDGHLDKAIPLSSKMAEHFTDECHQTCLVSVALLALALQDEMDNESRYGFTMKALTIYAKMAKEWRDFALCDVEGTA